MRSDDGRRHEQLLTKLKSEKKGRNQKASPLPLCVQKSAAVTGLLTGNVVFLLRFVA